MTIDARLGLFAALSGALVGGVAILGAAAAAVAPAGDYWAAGERSALLAALAPADARLIAAPAFGLLVRIERADSVRTLYRHGALLVLPARAGGCLSLRRGG